MIFFWGPTSRPSMKINLFTISKTLCNILKTFGILDKSCDTSYSRIPTFLLTAFVFDCWLPFCSKFLYSTVPLSLRVAKNIFARDAIDYSLFLGVIMSQKTILIFILTSPNQDRYERGYSDSLPWSVWKWHASIFAITSLNIVWARLDTALVSCLVLRTRL